MARFVGLSRFSLSTLFFAVLLYSSFAEAQIPPSTSTTSTPIPGVGHDYLGGVAETVNPVNGSVSFRIPVSMPPGRGITLPFSFAYDSNGVNYMSPNFGTFGAWVSPMSSITSQAGWSESVPVEDNAEITWTGIPDGGGHNTPCFAFVNYVFQDASGNRHNLDLTTYNETGKGGSATCNNGSNWPFGFGALTVTQGGEPDQAILATIDNTDGLSPGPVNVTDGDGTVFQFPVVTDNIYGVMATSVTDRNGNFTTINPPASSGSPYSYIDTAGRTVLQDSGFANSPETVTISGLGAPYKLTWTALSTPSFVTPTTVVSGKCGNPGHYPWYSTGYAGNGNDHAISVLTLPNGKSFSFAYDPNYGLVNKITYPTGGYIQYTWGIYAEAEAGIFYNTQGEICQMLYGVPAITDRYVSFDGSTVALHQQFQYPTPTWADNGNYSWTSKQTKVITTDNVRNTSFTTVYNYSPIPADRPPNSSGGPTQSDPVESSIVYSDTTGSLLETVTKTWQSTSLLKSQENTYPSGLASETTWTYNANGLPTQQDDYDFGTTAPPNPPGPLLRQTVTNYATIGTTHIVNKPSSVQIFDSTGTNLVAETDYAYDGYGSGGITSVTATNHDNTDFPPSYTTRGNLTTKTAKCLQSGCSNAVTTYTYDETGQILSMTDPCGNGSCNDMTGTAHTTTYSYADNYSSGTPPGDTNALLTKVTDALGHSASYAYGYGDGQLTGSTDPNSQPINYKYNTPPSGCSFSDGLDRLSEIDYPDGGKTTYCYNDSAYNPSTPSPSVTTTKTITSSLNEVSTTAFDGMNHKVKTILSSDPDGATYTATSYDGNARPYQVYNPTRCNPPTTNCGTETTWGITTYNYDALGRTMQVAEPDGSQVLTSYSGNQTTVTDETNNQRTSTSDALGRLTAVSEAPGVSGYNFTTQYQYDALNNLICAVQKGTDTTAFTTCAAASTTWRPRSFVYDSLSRLTNAANPESGAISYTYDANSNLVTRLAPQANQTGTAQTTTTYSYDVLNRPLHVAHSYPGNATASWAYDGSAISGCPGISIPTLSSPTNLIGRRSSKCSQESTSSFSYDPMGRLIAEAHTIGLSATATYNTGYSYYLDGSLHQSTYPSTDVVTYTVGGAGRVTGVSDATNTFVAGPSSPPMYAPHGAVKTMTQGTGITTTNIYNVRLQPLLLSAGSTFSLCYDFHAKVAINDLPCQFSASTTGDNGNVFQVLNNLDSTRSAVFSYDPLNRISQANTSNTTSTNCWGESYTIDAWGNLTNVGAPPGIGGNCQTGGLNAAPASTANQLNGYCYDAAGNLLLDSPCPTGSFTPTYEYDAENRLYNPQAEYTYWYDADGVRIRKAASATLGTMYWPGPNGEYLMETNGSGTISEEYIYFNGARIARVDRPSGMVHYYFSDQLGSASVITNSSGVVQEQDY